MDIQKLKDNGISYDEGVYRFSGKEAIYLKYLRRLPEQTMLQEAKKALMENNIQEAFQNFHNLKAFVGNLSINVLFEQVCELTEIFRTGSVEGIDVDSKMAALEKIYDQVCKAIIEADQ